MENTPLVINIDTGAITFRTSENANHCNVRPISYKHAKMVESGELELKPLLSAIKRHMMSAEGFDYEKYADERRNLNVRHTALHADDREKVQDAPQSDYVSDAEIASAQDNAGVDAVDAAVNETRKRGRPPKAQAAGSTSSDDLDIEVS